MSIEVKRTTQALLDYPCLASQLAGVFIFRTNKLESKKYIELLNTFGYNLPETANESTIKAVLRDIITKAVEAGLDVEQIIKDTDERMAATTH